MNLLYLLYLHLSGCAFALFWCGFLFFKSWYQTSLFMWTTYKTQCLCFCIHTQTSNTIPVLARLHLFFNPGPYYCPFLNIQSHEGKFVWRQKVDFISTVSPQKTFDSIIISLEIKQLKKTHKNFIYLFFFLMYLYYKWMNMQSEHFISLRE